MSATHPFGAHRQLLAVGLVTGLVVVASDRPASAANAVAPSSSIDEPPAAGDAEAARFCRPLHFVAYSTLAPNGQRVEESISWDAAQLAYVIRGPVLAFMLDDPGVRSAATGNSTAATFTLAIRKDPSKPIDRLCEEDFQEAAQCDPHGDVFYTQTYTGCDLQRLTHVVELTPDNAGTLPLIALRFQDVQGNFGDPLYLAAGSDLRQRIR